MASGFLMTGHEIGAALGVAVLSAVASTAGTLSTSGGAADAFSRGFICAAVIGASVAVFAIVRMPKTKAAGGAVICTCTDVGHVNRGKSPAACLSRSGGARIRLRERNPREVRPTGVAPTC